MADDRVIKAKVDLDVNQAVPAAKELEHSLTGVDRAVNEADRDIKDFGRDAVKAAMEAAAAAKLLKTEMDGAAAKVKDVGSNAKGIETLNRSISDAATKTRALADEFSKTGKIDVFEKMRAGQKELKSFEKMRTDFTSALTVGAKDAGKVAGRDAADGFSNTFSSSVSGFLQTPIIGPFTVAMVSAAVLAALPALSAALMGTAGLGGIALGLVGQFKDPQVHKAITDMGSSLMETLTRATTSFREPLVAAAGIFGGALNSAIDSIDFSGLSKLLAPLASGFGGLIGNMMPGFNDMLKAAGPILLALSQDLTIVGTDVSVMFSEFARGGKGAQEALRVLLMILGGLLVEIGGVVLALSKLTEWFIAGGQAVGTWVENVGKAVSTLADGFPLLERWGNGVKNLFSQVNGANDLNTSAKALTAMGADAALTADDFDKLAGQINKVTNDANTLAEAMTIKVLNSMMSSDQAVLGFDESLTRMSESVKHNGKTLDEHTVKGQANREAVLALIQANIAEYQTNVANNMTLDEANAKYSSNQAQIEKTTTATYGNTAAVHGMIDKYKNVPAQVKTDIALNGLTDAINGLSDLIRELNGMPSRRSVDVYVQVHDAQLQRAQDAMNRLNGSRWGDIYQHADVGLLSSAKVYASQSPGRYMIAEPQTGGEAFVPRFGSYSRSTAILDQASRWYGGRFMAGGGMSGGGGGGTTSVNLTLTLGPGGTSSDRALAQIAHYALRAGSLQLRAGNVPVEVG